MTACIANDGGCLLSITIANQLKLFNLDNDSVIMEHTNLSNGNDHIASTEENKRKTKLCADEGSENFVSLAFSPTTEQRYFVAITENKMMMVWRIAQPEKLLTAKTLSKRPTCLVCCHHENTVIVGDKSGDVYQCQVGKSCIDQSPKLLLGHISMVLDVAMTKDDQFVITADRDEKIRVSSYPNAYNIHCFCLSHTRLVSCIALSSPDRLVSTSADGSVKLWAYKDGALLAESRSVEPPFVAMQLIFHGNAIAVVGEGSNEVKMYEIDGDSFQVKPSLYLSCRPLGLCFLRNGDMIVLVKSTTKPIVLLQRLEGAYKEIERDSLLRLGNLFGHYIDFLHEPSFLTSLLKPVQGKRNSEPITPESTINICSAMLSKIQKRNTAGEIWQNLVDE